MELGTTRPPSTSNRLADSIQVSLPTVFIPSPELVFVFSKFVSVLPNVLDDSTRATSWNIRKSFSYSRRTGTSNTKKSPLESENIVFLVVFNHSPIAKAVCIQLYFVLFSRIVYKRAGGWHMDPAICSNSWKSSSRWVIAHFGRNFQILSIF